MISEALTKDLTDLDVLLSGFIFEDDPDLCDLLDLVIHNLSLKPNGEMSSREVKILINRWAEVFPGVRAISGEKSMKVMKHISNLNSRSSILDDKEGVNVSDFLRDLKELSDDIAKNNGAVYKLSKED